ncbi:MULTISPECIES: response regulator transcription factor [Chryseobacterium]|uniref:LuxR C-terminal-related transcriptional regulator n=1 Tax=Chryseobacterium gambrini TaxID=373672 RepID=A0AAJ1R239_9FLAO|nr:MULTISPECIES: LuxR C-terminal-related transcriptional regulator [Chryseobacterium]MDN4012208.1 LuxR C-terminal-related transcriptional regulator [Chryseobacterium gambrini]MDN4031428.1 LuxR C-terminal-related transcriptional regulator [Chryseobacterium gambrini]QWA36918.1 helix-turn-helix transcriptional regulator [Chryseobacterium sp. ZHDP1]WBV51151.1 LuxR C-terminal-related transcriptional regulator [Chryseobacterium gambrini]
MDEINQFFSDRNTVNNLSQNELLQTFDYLEPVKAFARITYKSLYIIDYQKKSFDYVSDNPLFLCGHTPDEVKELGYAFYFKHVKKDDLQLLLKINEVGFNFYENIPVEERKLYTISYDFHLVKDSGKSILINHKLTPLFLNKEGKIWKAMCIVSLSQNNTSGNIQIFKDGSDDIWLFQLSSNKWEKSKKIKLSDRETEILLLYAQGLTINEIAEKMYLTADTIKFHRRKLFDKINVQNITEALAYATNNKLI